jgi:hypothetical protein
LPPLDDLIGDAAEAISKPVGAPLAKPAPLLLILMLARTYIVKIIEQSFCSAIFKRELIWHPVIGRIIELSLIIQAKCV